MKFLVVIIAAFFTANVYAQKRLNSSRTPVFSSGYLDINAKLCKEIDVEAFECEPVGDYRLRFAYHRLVEQIWIETVGGEEVARIPSVNAGELTRLIGKIEWRTANGKPFAVIARFVTYTYEEERSNKTLIDDYLKLPQIVVVKGLTGFEQIALELNTKTTPNVNQKARDLADEGFIKSRRLVK